MVINVVKIFLKDRWGIIKSNSFVELCHGCALITGLITIELSRDMFQFKVWRWSYEGFQGSNGSPKGCEPATDGLEERRELVNAL